MMPASFLPEAEQEMREAARYYHYQAPGFWEWIISTKLNTLSNP